VVNTIEIVRGDTWNPDPLPHALDPDGDDYDFTGATVWMTFKVETDDADSDDNAVVKLFWIDGGDSDGITISDPTSGVFEPTMTSEQTSSFRISQTYVYDVQVMNAVGDIETPDQGKLLVKRDVTRRITTP